MNLESPCVFETVGAPGSWGWYMTLNNKRGLAHRLRWEEIHGPIPAGLFVCHKCDTSWCTNVDHLFLGTPAENTHDAMQKGRLASRSNGRSTNALKTHCLRGHEYTPENTRKISHPNGSYRRDCFKCIEMRNKERAVAESEGRKITNRAKTHCDKGHEFTPENTRTRFDKQTGGRRRTCRTCLRETSRINDRKYRQQKKAKQGASL